MLSNTSKAIIIGNIVFSAIGAVVGFFLVPEAWYGEIGGTIISAQIGFLIGLVLGTATSIGKTILIEKGVNAYLNMGDKSRAASAMRAAYLGRFALTAVVLVLVVIFLGVGGIVGAAVGTIANTLGSAFARIIEPLFKGKEGKE
ncbi:MAG: hypothetical protein FWC69_00685 [Defluviitaleaceae bacterium]|nr:hypothetical protein [Defluviitaleaceae bacterium]